MRKMTPKCSHLQPWPVLIETKVYGIACTVGFCSSRSFVSSLWELGYNRGFFIEKFFH